MLWNDIAELVTYDKTKNNIGDTVKIPLKRQVFVNKKSVRQNEYYQALSTGLKPELMLEIRDIDYQDEEIIEYNDKKYRITRVFSKNQEITELICERVI